MSYIPLAEQLRPKKLENFVVQEEIVAVIEQLLTKSSKTDFFPSLIFWGAPGTGKATLARIISTELRRTFYEFSAVNTSIKEVEQAGPHKSANQLSKKGHIENTDIENALQKRNLSFDLKGEEFYNTTSALHKSMRGSDPDAALYWLERMLEAGQDPLYVVRRLIRFASEDVGLEDPQALILAVSAFKACEGCIGMPECELALAQTVVYLAKAPKSNKLYMAYGEVKDDVQSHGNLPVPLEIRNAPTKFMKNIGYGKGYKYQHSLTAEKTDQDYLPDKLVGKKYL